MKGLAFTGKIPEAARVQDCRNTFVISLEERAILRLTVALPEPDVGSLHVILYEEKGIPFRSVVSLHDSA